MDTRPAETFAPACRLLPRQPAKIIWERCFAASRASPFGRWNVLLRSRGAKMMGDGKQQGVRAWPCDELKADHFFSFGEGEAEGR
jgi:hypothetical protein